MTTYTEMETQRQRIAQLRRRRLIESMQENEMDETAPARTVACSYCRDVNEGPECCPFCGKPMDHNPHRTRPRGDGQAPLSFPSPTQAERARVLAIVDKFWMPGAGAMPANVYGLVRAAIAAIAAPDAAAEQWCPECEGTGGDDGEDGSGQCPRCGGTGKLKLQHAAADDDGETGEE